MNDQPPYFPPANIIQLLLAWLLRSFINNDQYHQTLVYVAIGSCSPINKPDNENQEWPSWLQEFHRTYPNCPIRVILIDPEYRKMLQQVPFQIVHRAPNQYGHMLTVNPDEGDVQLNVVPLSIDMMNSMDGSQDPFNIIALAQEFADLCTENPQVMVVMDAFTGHNLHEFRGSVDITTPGTFLLGGEYNRDSGCFRDFSMPGTSPIIVPGPGNRLMFLTPDTIDSSMRRTVMSMKPEMNPTITQKSLRMWIEREYDGLKRLIVHELLLLLRMFTKIDRDIDVIDSIENIKRSIERLKVHDISRPTDVHRHMRRLISEIARHYAKELSQFEFEVDILITCISTEPDIYKYSVLVSEFFKTHFPKYPFE
jgi:hypothetical protein